MIPNLVDSTDLPDSSCAFKEFLDLWRLYSYRMSATIVPLMAKLENELTRDGLRPFSSRTKRMEAGRTAFEEGCPELLEGEIASAEPDPPITLDNQGIFFQPSLPIGPYPHGSNLTYYFEYSLNANRQHRALPTIGYALPGLRRFYAGGAPDCICLCLSPIPYIYIQSGAPILIQTPQPITARTTIGIGLRKVPFSALLDPPTIEPINARSVPKFAYCVFVTFGGKLIFSKLSPAYPIELQPFVNFHSSTGTDCWNISGSPNHPWLFDLPAYLNEQETIAKKNCIDYEFALGIGEPTTGETSSKLRKRGDSRPLSFSKSNKIAVQTSETLPSSSDSSTINDALSTATASSSSVEVLLPNKDLMRAPYTPLSKHQITTTFDDILLLPDITLFLYCYFDYNQYNTIIPGYEPWKLVSKVGLHYSPLIMTEVVENSKISIQKLSEYCQNYGLIELLPAIAEWSRDRRELKRLIEHAAIMSCSYILAYAIGDFFSNLSLYNPRDTFVPMEMSMRAKLLLLLPHAEYADVMRSMPRISSWSLIYMESAYDEYRRKTALGLQPEWTLSLERPFWLSLLGPVTALRSLPKWKFSFTTADIASYVDYITERITQSPGSRKKVALFNVTSYIHLPFSLLPIQSLDLLSLFHSSLVGLYEARKVARSRYQQYQSQLAAFSTGLAQLITQSDAVEEDMGAAPSSSKQRARLQKECAASINKFQEYWGLNTFGTDIQPTNPREIAASLLWIFGDVSELTEIIGIQLPPQPLATRLRNWFSSFIWEIDQNTV